MTPVRTGTVPHGLPHTFQGSVIDIKSEGMPSLGSVPPDRTGHLPTLLYDHPIVLIRSFGADE